MPQLKISPEGILELKEEQTKKEKELVESRQELEEDQEFLANPEPKRQYLMKRLKNENKVNQYLVGMTKEAKVRVKKNTEIVKTLSKEISNLKRDQTTIKMELAKKKNAGGNGVMNELEAVQAQKAQVQAQKLHEMRVEKVEDGIQDLLDRRQRHNAAVKQLQIRIETSSKQIRALQGEVDGLMDDVTEAMSSGTPQSKKQATNMAMQAAAKALQAEKIADAMDKDYNDTLNPFLVDRNRGLRDYGVEKLAKEYQTLWETRAKAVNVGKIFSESTALGKKIKGKVASAEKIKLAVITAANQISDISRGASVYETLLPDVRDSRQTILEAADDQDKILENAENLVLVNNADTIKTHAPKRPEERDVNAIQFRIGATEERLAMISAGMDKVKKAINIQIKKIPKAVRNQGEIKTILQEMAQTAIKLNKRSAQNTKQLEADLKMLQQLIK